jgi:NAD(P)-dependent dehydrogenase (short-subunit alcohol dehydrogenase family)
MARAHADLRSTPTSKMSAVKIDGSVALVTGADHGLGRVFARELASSGAARVELCRNGTAQATR